MAEVTPLIRDELLPPRGPARRHLISIADLTKEDVERLLALARTFSSSLEREVKKHLSDWTARLLADIARTDARERHELLTKRSGPYVANRCMRHLRAVWNTAEREHDLPRCPVVAVHWNKERRRQEPIP